MDKRTIKLPKGGILEIEVFAGLYELVRKNFGLREDTYVTDEQLQKFIFNNVKSAVEKAESQNVE